MKVKIFRNHQSYPQTVVRDVPHDDVVWRGPVVLGCGSEGLGELPEEFLDEGVVLGGVATGQGEDLL